MIISLWIWLIVAGVTGVLAGFLAGRQQSQIKLAGIRERLTLRETEAERLREQCLQSEKTLSELKIREATLKAQVQTLLDAEKKLADSFKSISSEALQTNNQSFLMLARQAFEKLQSEANGDLKMRQAAIESMVKPINETMARVNQNIGDLEKQRVGAYESLNQQVRSLLESQNQLKSETGNLVKALRSPIVRGRWGEIQLKRVVEMAGMLDHCDFFEQESTQDDEGARLRPDMIVRLPGGRSVVVDAKAPLSAYLEALEAQDDIRREERLKQHAQQIRQHMTKLGRKTYWDQFQPAPDFVILFLPGEIFFSEALKQDPSLIEAGVEQKVILATPTTLIAVLRAVAYGWRQEGIARNAQLIADLGRELHKRLCDMSAHLARVGRSLGQSVDAYNGAIGSFESRVLVSARKFRELEAVAADSEIAELEPIDHITRALESTSEADSSNR